MSINLLQNYGVSPKFLAEATGYPDFQLARIIAQHRGHYNIVTETLEGIAELSGKIRHETHDSTMLPAVGDYVMVSLEKNSNAIIHHVLSRKSMFTRKAVGKEGQAQIISANIDTVFICMSLNNNYNLSRLERYLAIAWDSGAIPVIVLTKSDLCENIEATIAEVESVSAFSDIITVSMFDSDIESSFRKYFEKNITGVFIGSSGVGKSTLINNISGNTAIETTEVGRGDKGRHTTTGREMFPCAMGGVLIDTPGMRELGIDTADLSTSFEDIELLSNECKFSDCSHTAETGCAVLRAIDDGHLDQRRLSNYRKILNESSYSGLSSKELEKKKLERMFKDVGGMKNMRKFMQDSNKRS